MVARAVRIATYNVHRCVGADGLYDADRVAAVIRELDVDAVGLQEVDARYHLQNDLDQIEHLQRLTGMTAVPGATLVNHRGYYGNALLTRHPVLAVRHYDLSLEGRERRGALDVELDCEGSVVRVIVTHFGLLARERREQVQAILRLVDLGRPAPLAIVGDFNEWSFINRTVRVLDGRLGRSVAVRSFPTRWPLFALDRLWVQPRGALEAVWAHMSPQALLASDHLPVVGRVSAGWGDATQRT
jgi:endonuclease/exonuclease/phosphatase family metal-dependent hydrolase